MNQREVGNGRARTLPRHSGALCARTRTVILVGEMRDLETIEAAIRAAETGALGLRYPAHHGGVQDHRPCGGRVPCVTQQNQIRVQLSTSLISCALVRHCSWGVWIRRGLVAAYEFLVITPAVANLIRDNKTFRIDSMIQTGEEVWDAAPGRSPVVALRAWHDLGRRDGGQVQRTKSDIQTEGSCQAGGVIGRPELDEADDEEGKAE
jgi:twitching motility protein PilT